jgi:hypothetical protein
MTSFSKSLFDSSFDTFITKRVASVLWLVNVVITFIAGAAIALLLLAQTIQAISDENFLAAVLSVLLLLVGVPLGVWLVLITTRLAFEASVALIAIAENTARTGGGSAGPKAEANPVSPIVSPPGARALRDQVQTSGAVSSEKQNFASRGVGSYTANDLNTMMDDYDANPTEWAQDVLDQEEFALWQGAGEPSLRPWIRAGLPAFPKWLK